MLAAAGLALLQERVERTPARYVDARNELPLGERQRTGLTRAILLRQTEVGDRVLADKLPSRRQPRRPAPSVWL